MTIGLIVEGVNDRQRIEQVDTTVKCYILHGTPYGASTLRRIVERALAECDKVFVMTDPDEAGNRMAARIKELYPDLPRLEVDPMKCRVQRVRGNFKYGVEHCSLPYIAELLEFAKEVQV